MAASQGKRALELKQTINIYRSLKLAGFDENSEIGVMALVELEDDQGTMFCFLGPRGGGARIWLDGIEVAIVTAAAPLGRALLGKMIGDIIDGPSGRELEIVSVW